MSQFAILNQKTFGPWGRYAVQECRDRFGATTFIVLDAEKTDETGLRAIIRQAPTEAEAVKGLDTETPK